MWSTAEKMLIPHVRSSASAIGSSLQRARANLSTPDGSFRPKAAIGMVSALSTHCRSSANMHHCSLLLFLRPRFSTAGTSRSSFHPLQALAELRFQLFLISGSCRSPQSVRWEDRGTEAGK